MHDSRHVGGRWAWGASGADDDGADQALGYLAFRVLVRVVPVSPSVTGAEAVDELATGEYGILRDAGNAVFAIGHVDAVPMKTGSCGDIAILQHHLHQVTLLGVHSRPRAFAVDRVDPLPMTGDAGSLIGSLQRLGHIRWSIWATEARDAAHRSFVVTAAAPIHRHPHVVNRVHLRHQAVEALLLLGVVVDAATRTSRRSRRCQHDPDGGERQNAHRHRETIGSSHGNYSPFTRCHMPIMACGTPSCSSLGIQHINRYL